MMVRIVLSDELPNCTLWTSKDITVSIDRLKPTYIDPPADHVPGHVDAHRDTQAQLMHSSNSESTSIELGSRHVYQPVQRRLEKKHTPTLKIKNTPPPVRQELVPDGQFVIREPVRFKF